MIKPLGNYSFLPWLRLGLANQIEAGVGQDGRAVITVKLDLEGAPVPGGSAVAPLPVDRKVALFGPGDIQGVERRAVVRTEPRDWSTNFESNYLPAIEFYDEDFPWRYTPAAPDDKGRLLPWLALLVLEEKEISPEFTDGKDMTGKPLPYIQVTDRSVFPDPTQMWAWAHVHVNRSLASPAGEIVSTDMNQVLPKLQGFLNENADLALSRIVSPRKLQANKAYHAFLIPAFESGRRTGLGLPHDGNIPATTSAWAGSGALDMPYYYRWHFHTGGKGDFESLVRLLKPRTVDHRVGRRDMDVQKPGLNISGVPSELHGILKLGGALQVPFEALDKVQQAERKKYDDWAKPPNTYPQEIQKDIARVVNLADDYAELAVKDANFKAKVVNPEKPTEGDPDPVVTPPLYGMWHAMAKRVLTERSGAPITPNDNWLHELNLDPRWRVAAGFGTRVVQEQQEKYMDAAWQQIGDVLEGNRRIRLGQAACGVSQAWFDGDLQQLKDNDLQKGLQLAGPLNKRTRFLGETVHSYYTGKRVPPTMTSGALRRAMRPRGRLVRELPFHTDGGGRRGGGETLSDVFGMLNEGSITPAPMRTPKERPKVDLTDNGLGTVIDFQLRPDVTIPSRVKSIVRLPQRIEDEIGTGGGELEASNFASGDFVEAMVYPQFDTPMYEPLKNISSELFLPNVELIPDNSITLLEPNQEFIEAYMVGLNHEFARELLWREYPTDQRGSYFRQFWGVGGTFNSTGMPDEEWKKTLRDIKAIHDWDETSKLGSHKNRVSANGELVLVIRGELLKRYPTAVVYAHQAVWQLGSDGKPDRTKVRLLEPLTDIEEGRPPATKVLTPMYEAKIDPDIYCFGFPLSAEKARGKNDEPGWYFVLKERPGEPRFGLDIDKVTKIEVWNDLSWEDMAAGPFLKIENRPFRLEGPVTTGGPDKKQQHDEDVKVAWSADMSAADLAYILFQTPVLVGVHASEMLLPKNP